MDPDLELIDRYSVRLPDGTRLTYLQTLWGKVVALEAIETPDGRFGLEDFDRETAAVRRLLDGITLFGELAIAPDDPLIARLGEAIGELLSRFGESWA